MIKFVHTGDLHLGLKFNNVSFQGDKASERRRELWSTFERIVDYAKDEKADFLLIAGDLFEESYFTIGDINRIRDVFKNAEDVNIIISAGNHDFIGKNSLYNRVQWTDNVTIFNGEGIQQKEFKELNTVIYGYSWDMVEIRENNLLNGLNNKVDKEKNNILVIHGDVSNNSSYLPLNIQDLNSLNMDYIALGHIHKPQIISNKIAYCGCPEPLDFGETGERGIIKVSIDNKKLEFELFPFSKRKFLEIEVEIDESMGYVDIVQKLKNINIGNKSMDFYRINLKGFIQRNIVIEDLHKDIESEFYHIELVDKTIWDYDLQLLEEDNRDNIIGQFISSMKEKGLDNPMIKDALYFGLEALLKERE
ncbi:DNA repair exonuclease [Tissierella sp.]|uniref:metallophosphoesterase family protein n=1 Tax=Tissierella sp. TaxID=41274 RepID=UPI00285CD39A|nr:DNA repair exonuclease [Tissierella sp.]MDR7855807.1 DNA repair exonuclease [Tissierella sp.]